MSSKRRKAREVALKALYQCDLVNANCEESLRQVMNDEVFWPALESFTIDFLKKSNLDDNITQEVTKHLLGDVLSLENENNLEALLQEFEEESQLEKGFFIRLKEKLKKKMQDFSSVEKFAKELVSKTIFELSKIDEIIEKFADNWSLERMATLDRAILRFSVCELLFFREIPINVTINEAVELAKKYSTERSREFVNGILDKIQKKLQPEKDDPREKKGNFAESKDA